MSHQIRKFIAYFLAPLITMLLTLMRMPDLCQKLKSIHPDLGVWLDYFVILATIFIYYYSFWSPLKLFETQAKKKWEVMKDMAARMEDVYGGKFDLNFNIMLAQNGFCHFIEPVKENSAFPYLSWKGKRFSIYGRILKVIWEHGNHGVPPGFRMTINQGLCGKTFREGKETTRDNIKGGVLPLDFPEENSAALNNEQKKINEGLIIATSCPLVVTNKDVGGLKKKIIGVLNVESRSPSSTELFVEISTRDIFYKEIISLAKIYLKLHN